MGGFTGNPSAVRKALVALIALFGWGAKRKKKRLEGYPSPRCADCRNQQCTCD